MCTQPTTSVWRDENLRAWEPPWLYPEMRPWAHLLIGQFKRKRLDYWLNYYNRWKALLLTNRLTSIVDIVCTSDFWDVWGWNHMTDDSWFTSAIDLVGLHMHVLGAVVRKGKLHYCLPQFYFLISYQTHGIHGSKIFLHEYGHDASIRWVTHFLFGLLRLAQLFRWNTDTRKAMEAKVQKYQHEKRGK